MAKVWQHWQRWHPALAFALLVALANGLPLWLHGSPGFWPWPCISAACALLLYQGGQAHGLACIGGISIGMGIDFAVLPASAILSICSSGAPLDLLRAHLSYLPATSLAMFVILLFDLPRHAPPLQSAAVLVLKYGLMMVLMLLVNEAFKSGTLAIALPWSGDGMVSAMLVGMLVWTGGLNFLSVDRH